MPDGVNNEEIFAQLRQPPRFAWPTIILFLVSLSILLSSTYAALAGHIEYWTACVINGVAGYIYFTPLHDGLHRAVSQNKHLNDWIGRLSLFYFSTVVPFEVVRFVHFRHHRHANGPEDKGDAIVKIRPAFLRPFVWPFIDISYGWQYLKFWKVRPTSEKRSVLALILVTLFLWGGLVAAGYGRELLILWIIPQRISIFFMAMVFVYLPHTPHTVSEKEDPYKATNNREGAYWLWSPILMYQNFHLAHHLYPAVPFYRMRKIWNSRLDEHLSNDPAMVPAFGINPKNMNSKK